MHSIEKIRVCYLCQGIWNRPGEVLARYWFTWPRDLESVYPLKKKKKKNAYHLSLFFLLFILFYYLLQWYFPSHFSGFSLG